MPARGLRAALRAFRSVVEQERGDACPGVTVPDSHSGIAPGAWQSLLASGLFDRELYEALVGRQFPSARAAAKHSVRWGMARMYPWNLLISPTALPEREQAKWLAGDVEAILDYLGSERSLKRAWSPFFDPRAVPPRTDGATGDVLTYLVSLAEDSQLPTARELGDGALAWGDVRTRAVDVARVVDRQVRSARSRVTSEWDREAEEAWMVALADVPLEAPKGEPIVSVIMPVWNRPDRVQDAIASVQAQTLTEWELLVVDDGSTDTTPEVLRSIASADPRIRVLRRPHEGVSAARNEGLRQARGAFVAFLDSDNSWRSHFLATALRAMRRDERRVAYSAVRLIDDEGGVRIRAHDGGLEDLLVRNHVDMNALVVATELAREAGGFDQVLRRWVDHDFVIRLARLEKPALLPFIGCDYDDARAVDARITTSESESWQYVALEKALVDWTGERARAADRVVGRTSVVIPTYGDYRMTLRAVSSALEGAGDVEVVVVDNGSRPDVSLVLGTALACIPGARWLRLPRNLNFALGSNIGFAASSGSNVFFLNNDTVARPGWLAPLAATLESSSVVRGVQPLLVYPDDTIQTAGTVFPVRNALPTHHLVGHPKDDGDSVRGVAFSAVTAAALLMRADEVAELEGFDTRFVNGMEDVDLCLRARERFGGYFAVEVDSVIEHHESRTPGRWAHVPANRQLFLDRWRDRLPGPERDAYEAAGLEIAQMGFDRQPHAAPKPVLVRAATGPDGTPRRTRWNLKHAATPGPAGRRWGDTHFADALAAALRSAGHEVVTSPRGAHDSPAGVHDDVALAIRGTVRVHPQPGRTNVLWVISHPEDIDVLELREFDLVFAASEAWAHRMTIASGREVVPLLQAADTRRFYPPEQESSRGEHPVFVGQARLDSPRAIVMDALAAGLEPHVWGPRWEQHLPEHLVQGDYFPNEELGALYRRAPLVLNDHWTDMAEHGFISNRLFDAAACAAPVLSDPVPGIDELFGGLVQTYSAPEEIQAFAAGGAGFPSLERRLAIAAAIHRDHSFGARAAVLIDAVDRHRAATA